MNLATKTGINTVISFILAFLANYIAMNTKYEFAAIFLGLIAVLMLTVVNYVILIKNEEQN